MKKLVVLQLIIMVALFMSSHSEPLSVQYQQDLIDRLRYLKGQGPAPASMGNLEEQAHCATSAWFEAFVNRSELTGQYKTQAAMLSGRPVLSDFFDSPGGHFRIHYSTVGYDSVYQSHVDTLVGGNSVPLYVYRVALIADSVWNFEINHLGYPSPPSDGFYPAGDGSTFDIYLVNLGGLYYGQTMPDSQILGTLTATSFLEIHSTFDFGVPGRYIGNPIPAAEVTLAHEFFHAIHFGLNFTEWEGTSAQPRIYWWEMSATWMEEMAYDSVNDYYGYLPAFYNYPWVSLQDFSLIYQLHPYGAMVFPLYLSQRWDTTIIRDIWLKIRDYGVTLGPGPHFLQAADAAIFENSSGTMHLRDVFEEFSVWNLFTGARAARAPAGFKYKEAANYPQIPDSAFITQSHYPGGLTPWPNWPTTFEGYSSEKMTYFHARVPQNLGANYINLTAISLIPDSMTLVFAGVVSNLIDWNVSLVGFPVNVSSPAFVRLHSQPPNPVVDTVRIASLSNVVVIPAAALPNKDSYPGNYGYSYIIFDSAHADTTRYAIQAPYPNPIVVKSEADVMTFNVNQPIIPTGTPAFSVDIFDAAGEKIREIRSNSGSNGLHLTWSLDNNQNVKVAPGVYLVYCRLILGDGSPDITQKFKVAVIR